MRVADVSATGADRRGSTGLAYFDRMYEDPDPWGYETSWYEHRKYALTLAALPKPRYDRAFEPGCSIGVLTELLADRCDRLVAWDFHGASAARARDRLRSRPHVDVAAGEIPEQWPADPFDLVVLSEIAHYLGDPAHDRLIERVASTLEPGGDVVLVHWRGETDYPRTGDEVHERWRGDARFTIVVELVEDEFRLDVLRRSGDRAR